MKTRLSRLLLSFVVLVSACLRPVTDQGLVAEDHQLMAAFAQLENRYKRHEIPTREYSQDLSAMHQREEVIFARVRSHKFTDSQAANYFFSNRLKLPSPIDEAQKRVAEKESQ